MVFVDEEQTNETEGLIIKRASLTSECPRNM